MAEEKKTMKRKILKGYFLAGQKPKAEEFAKLIDSVLIQDEDGIRKTSPTTPLEITAVRTGTETTALTLNDPDDKPAWTIGMPKNDGKYGLRFIRAAGTKPSLSIDDTDKVTISGALTVEGAGGVRAKKLRLLDSDGDDTDWSIGMDINKALVIKREDDKILDIRKDGERVTICCGLKVKGGDGIKAKKLTVDGIDGITASSLKVTDSTNNSDYWTIDAAGGLLYLKIGDGLPAMIISQESGNIQFNNKNRNSDSSATMLIASNKIKACMPLTVNGAITTQNGENGLIFKPAEGSGGNELAWIQFHLTKRNNLEAAGGFPQLEIGASPSANGKGAPRNLLVLDAEEGVMGFYADRTDQTDTSKKKRHELLTVTSTKEGDTVVKSPGILDINGIHYRSGISIINNVDKLKEKKSIKSYLSVIDNAIRLAITNITREHTSLNFGSNILFRDDTKNLSSYFSNDIIKDHLIAMSSVDELLIDMTTLIAEQQSINIKEHLLSNAQQAQNIRQMSLLFATACNIDKIQSLTKRMIFNKFHSTKGIHIKEDELLNDYNKEYNSSQSLLYAPSRYSQNLNVIGILINDPKSSDLMIAVSGIYPVCICSHSQPIKNGDALMIGYTPGCVARYCAIDKYYQRSPYGRYSRSIGIAMEDVPGPFSGKTVKMLLLNR